jgi:hypothetical protein
METVLSFILGLVLGSGCIWIGYYYGYQRGRNFAMKQVTGILLNHIESLMEGLNEKKGPQAKRKTPKRDAQGHFIKITKAVKK